MSSRFHSFAFVVLSFLLVACVSSRTEKEFNDKKPVVALLIEPAKTVEKKTAINVLVAEYLHLAPKDSALISIFNSYLLYNLDEMGYKVIFEKNEYFDPALIRGVELVYSLKLGPLSFKEFKHKETATDGTNSKVVKMRGIEINPSALVVPGNTDPQGNKEALTARANALKEESQEGQFKQTYRVKDMVNGSKQGSAKYIYNVSKLEDGVFQNLCVDGAYQLAKEIDFVLKRLYQKQKKQKKQEG